MTTPGKTRIGAVMAVAALAAAIMTAGGCQALRSAFAPGKLEAAAEPDTAPEVKAWDCGETPETVTCAFEDDGVLRVSGTGAMANYGDDENPPPWRGDVAREWTRESTLMEALVKKFTLAETYTETGILDTVELASNVTKTVFYDCSGLTSVIIDNGVTGIGTNAFYGCDGLTSVNIPNSVKSIGAQAFYGCENLTFAAIPNSLEHIGEKAFTRTGITSVTIPGGVTRISLAAFAKSALTSVTIDSGATLIAPFAFIETPLTSVIIPNGVTEIGYAAFLGCPNLTSVTIPESVKEIGPGAFEDCGFLESMIVKSATPPNASEETGFFGGAAFDIVPGDACLYVPETAVDTYHETEGWKEFKCIKPLAAAYEEKPRVWDCGDEPWTVMCVLGDDGTLRVSGAGGMKDVSPTRGAPWRRNVRRAVIEDGVTHIGAWAFYKCRFLASVTIPNSVTFIGMNAFSGTALTSVTVPESVKVVSSGMFAGCSSLVSVALPNSLTYIGGDAFENCVSLKSLAIPPNVKLIDLRAFSRSGLTSITIPDCVTEIGEEAFARCPDLTSVTIGGGVETIGRRAFAGSDGLASVTVLTNFPPKLTESLFDAPPSNVCLYVPEDIVNVYRVDRIWRFFRCIKPIRNTEQ